MTAVVSELNHGEWRAAVLVCAPLLLLHCGLALMALCACAQIYTSTMKTGKLLAGGSSC